MLCLNCGASMETHCGELSLYRQWPAARHAPAGGGEPLPNCGETEVVIPHIEALHREKEAIATALVVKRARLAPEEIRFLRKYLG